MRTSIWLPCLLSVACTTSVEFDDLFVDAEVGDVGAPGGGDPDAPGDTGEAGEGRPNRITAAGAVCGDGPGPRRYEAVVAVAESRIGSVLFFQQETGNVPPNWSENHSIAVDNNDEAEQYMAYSQLDLGSTLADPVNDWEPGVSTVFECHHLELGGVMTYAFALLDDDGLISDCVVSGHDPEGMIEGIYERADEPAFDLTQCRISLD